MQTRIRQNRNRLLVERSKPDSRDTKYIHTRQENSQKQARIKNQNSKLQRYRQGLDGIESKGCRKGIYNKLAYTQSAQNKGLMF